MNDIKLPMFEDKELENDIEDYGVKQIEKYGGRAEKFKSPGRRSVPDRMITFSWGHLFFIEFKRPGKDATPKQKLDHQRRRDMGFEVYVIDTKQKMDMLLEAKLREYGLWD